MTATYSVLHASQPMSNSGWHRGGQPVWWARIGSGPTARFLDLDGKHRADRKLMAIVDVPPGTEVVVGAGRGKDAVRLTVTTVPA